MNRFDDLTFNGISTPSTPNVGFSTPAFLPQDKEDIIGKITNKILEPVKQFGEGLISLPTDPRFLKGTSLPFGAGVVIGMEGGISELLKAPEAIKSIAKIAISKSPEIISGLLKDFNIAEKEIPILTKKLVSITNPIEVKEIITPFVKSSEIAQKLPKIAPELEHLTQEARKNVAFHGTKLEIPDNQIDIGIGGRSEYKGVKTNALFLSDNINSAKEFGYTARSQEGQKIVGFKGINNLKIKDISDKDIALKNLDKYKNEGYDAIRFPELQGNTIAVFNTEKLSQMGSKQYNPKTDIQKIATDFYNQAIKIVSGEVPQIVQKFPSPLATPKNIIKTLSEVPSPELPKTPQLSKEDSSISIITQALKESKPLRSQQETLYSAERAKRLGESLAVGEKTTGEKGFYAELGKLKGELPKVQFEEIRSKISQEDIDNAFNMVKDNHLLGAFDKISARQGLGKLFGEFGGKVPTEGELNLLSRVFPKEFIDTILGKRSLWEKAKEAGYQLFNMPRSIMASFDLSAPFRQGIFMVGRKQFWTSFEDMFKSFGSESAFKALQESIVRKPTFDLMRDSKLALTDISSLLTQREEKFMSGWAENIPVAGKVIRASNRAYTGFLNKVRADVFESLINKADSLGLNPRANLDLTQEITKFVNSGTGRGSLGNLERAAVGLNSFFFSPRLMVSRLTLLNPLYYIKADPFVRKEALKSLLTFAGSGMTILGLAKLGGAKVGVDPRSSDFGKIIIGKTRFDIWGGFQQYIRMASQFISGQYVSSTSGKVSTLGEGYKPITRFDILLRQVESKEAPVISFFTDILKQQDYTGQPLSIPKEIASRFYPMAISDLVDIYRDNPELLPLGVAGIFGTGIQTYLPKKQSINRFNQ